MSYRDSAAATATFTVQRIAAGVRSGKGCVAARGKGHRHAKRCALLVALGSFTHADHAGANSFTFTGRMKHGALAPGRYILRAVASDSAGSGPPVTAAFAIIGQVGGRSL